MKQQQLDKEKLKDNNSKDSNTLFNIKTPISIPKLPLNKPLRGAAKSISINSKTLKSIKRSQIKTERSHHYYNDASPNTININGRSASL